MSRPRAPQLPPIRKVSPLVWRYTAKEWVRIVVFAGVGAVAAWYLGRNKYGAAAFLALTGFGIVLAEADYEGYHLDGFLSAVILETVASRWSLEASVDQVLDDALVMDDDSVVGVVRVESLDFEMLSDRDLRSTWDTVQELLAQPGLDVEIHSRQRLLDLSEYESVDGREVVTDHFVVIRDSPDISGVMPGFGSGGSNELVDRLVRVSEQCDAVERKLKSGELHAERVTGDDLEDLADRFSFDNAETGFRTYRLEDDQSERKQYRRALYVTDYPRSLQIGWLSDVLHVEAPGLVDAVQVVKPYTDKDRRKRRRRLGLLKTEILKTTSPIRRSDLEAIEQAHREAQQAASESSDAWVKYGVVLVAHGSTPEEADETFGRLTSLLDDMQIGYRPVLVRTRGAAKTESLLTLNGLQKTWYNLASAAASAFSFAARHTIEQSGVVFGDDVESGSPVILNRFSWQAPHIAVFGKTGSGKSYLSKLLLLRRIRQEDNLQVRIIDVKNDEYKPITEVFGGTKIVVDDQDLDKITPSSDIVRYTFTSRSKATGARLAKALNHIYADATENDSQTIVLVDEAHRVLNDPEAESTLDKMVREGRADDISVQIVTQRPGDFITSESGMLSDITCFLFMFFKFQDQAGEKVIDYFHLSEQEVSDILGLATGTDLSYSEVIVRDPVRKELRVESTPEEHQLITGDVSDESLDRNLSRSELRERYEIQIQCGDARKDQAEEDIEIPSGFSGELGLAVEMICGWFSTSDEAVDDDSEEDRGIENQEAEDEDNLPLIDNIITLIFALMPAASWMFLFWAVHTGPAYLVPFGGSNRHAKVLFELFIFGVSCGFFFIGFAILRDILSQIFDLISRQKSGEQL